MYSIDSIFITDNYRKKFNIQFEKDGFIDTTFWIEGIGGVFGTIPYPLGRGYGDDENIKELICYKEYDEVLLSNPNIFATCDSFHSGINLINVDQNNFFIYPNPIDKNAQFNISGLDPDFYSIFIFSLDGKLSQKVTGIWINNSYSIQLTNLPSGYYLISVQSNHKLLKHSFIIN